MNSRTGRFPLGAFCLRRGRSPIAAGVDPAFPFPDAVASRGALPLRRPPAPGRQPLVEHRRVRAARRRPRLSRDPLHRPSARHPRPRREHPRVVDNHDRMRGAHPPGPRERQRPLQLLPTARAAGEDGRDPRRDHRRPLRAGDRGGLARAGVRGVRLRLPLPRRADRAARRGPPDHQGPVDGRAGGLGGTSLPPARRPLPAAAAADPTPASSAASARRRCSARWPRRRTSETARRGTTRTWSTRSPSYTRRTLE
jgi:hypothetical protein